jgi:tetratricopeptide (TPR) repeat protein
MNAKAKGIAKGLLVLGTVAALVGYVQWSGRRQKARERRDHITESLYNQGQYVRAAEAYTEMLRWAPEAMRDQLRRDVADSYLRAGEDPTRPLAESARLYRKARQYAPQALEPRHERALRAAEGLPGAPETDDADDRTGRGGTGQP